MHIFMATGYGCLKNITFIFYFGALPLFWKNKFIFPKDFTTLRLIEKVQRIKI